MWYLTLHRWVGDRGEAIKSTVDDHLAWMRDQQRAGEVLIAGPTRDGDLGIIVFGHMSRAGPDALGHQGPLVAGAYRQYEVVEWAAFATLLAGVLLVAGYLAWMSR